MVAQVYSIRNLPVERESRVVVAALSSAMTRHHIPGQLWERVADSTLRVTRYAPVAHKVRAERAARPTPDMKAPGSELFRVKLFCFVSDMASGVIRAGARVK